MMEASCGSVKRNRYRGQDRKKGRRRRDYNHRRIAPLKTELERGAQRAFNQWMLVDFPITIAKALQSIETILTNHDLSEAYVPKSAKIDWSRNYIDGVNNVH